MVWARSSSHKEAELNVGPGKPFPKGGACPQIGVSPGTYRKTLTDIRAELRVEEEISIHRGGKEVKYVVLCIIRPTQLRDYVCVFIFVVQ